MGTIDYGSAQVASKEILMSLRAKATHPTRIATLDRLEAAVVAITSGEAFQLARRNQRDTTRFRPSRRKIIAEDIGEFVLLKQFIEGPNTNWTGPTADFIRHDADMKLYLAAVTLEMNPQSSKNSKSKASTLSGEVEQIIEKLPTLSDQLALRRALERGKSQAGDADFAKYILKLVAAIDLDKIDRKRLSVPEILAHGKAGLGPAQKAILVELLRRITHRSVLGEIGLVYRQGRGKMAFGSGSELIKDDELSLLASLCDYRLPEGD